MKRYHSAIGIWLLSRFAPAALLLSCGNDEPLSRFDGGLDAGRGSNESPNRVDAAHASTPDPSKPDGATMEEGDVDVGGPPAMGAYEKLLEAQDANVQTLCDCEFLELGFDDVETCFDAIRRPDFARECSLKAYEKYSFGNQARVSCATEQRWRFVDCVAEAGCEGLQQCTDVRERDRQDCPFGDIAAVLAFSDDANDCELPARFGESSTCPEAASDASGPLVFTGVTTGKGDDHTISCADPDFTSPDIALQWTAPAAGSYRVDTIGSQFLTALAVLDTCDGPELACSAPSTALVGEASLTVTVLEGQTVVLIVEGDAETDSGYYVVNINPI